MSSRLSTQFSWILVGRIVAAALQAVTLVILARALGPQEFGILTAVLGITIWLQAVADLGIGKMVVRERSDGSSPELVAGALWLNARSSLVLGISLGLAFVLAGSFFNTIFFLMLPLAFSVAGEKNADTWLGVAIADGDTHLNSLNLVGRRAGALGIFLALNLIGMVPLLSYSVAVAVSAAGSVIFARIHVSRLVGAPRSSMRVVFSCARPFWVNTLAVQLRNLDSAIVGLISSATVAGYYATASRLTGPLRMLPTSLAVVILPHVARTRQNSIRPVIRLVLSFGICVGFLYIALLFAVPWGVPTILGEAYRSAILPLQIVLLGLVFAGFTSLLGAVLQGRGMQRQVATVSICGTIYLLATLVMFTILHGAEGAAFALASSFALEAFTLSVMILVNERRRETSVV